MVFGESIARLLLVVHTAVAVACVAASTHLVVWLRRWRRGELGRVAAVRRFGWIAASLYLFTFVLGNLLYPTYKVRVRAQFLDDPTEVTREVAARAAAARRLEATRGKEAGEPPQPTEVPARRAARVARWFDVKEHWVALGLALSLAVAVMLAAYDPKKHPPVLGPLAFWLALGAAGATWIGAVIGVTVSSYRAVGGL